MKKVLLLVLAMALVGAAFVVRWQDPSCSPENQENLGDIVQSLKNQLPVEETYVSTPDCEDGSSLTATLSTSKAPINLSEKLRDICTATSNDEMTCTIDGEEFELSADSLTAGTQFELALVLDR